MTKQKTRKLPVPSLSQEEKRSLPFNGSVVSGKRLVFSFSAFDRQRDFFNLGGSNEDKTIGGQWFLKLLDTLKSISNKSVIELMGRSTHELHRIDWSKTNTDPPKGFEQLDYWQLRLDKSSGRVIGTIIDSVFYVIWLDPYHNLTDSEGYGGIEKYPAPCL